MKTNSRTPPAPTPENAIKQSLEELIRELEMKGLGWEISRIGANLIAQIWLGTRVVGSFHGTLSGQSPLCPDVPAEMLRAAMVDMGKKSAESAAQQ